MRSVQLFTHTTESKWLDKIKFLGVYAMKLFLIDIGVSPAIEFVGLGAMQAFEIRLDDLLVGGALSESEEGKGYAVNFLKGKLHALSLRMVPTSSPAHRSGRMGMSFVWYNEAEAMESASDLARKKTTDLPTLKTFFQSPGVTISPASRGITKVWVPPPSSWVRDYVRIGRDASGASATDSYGLPVGRVILGYQNLDAKSASESYRSEDCSIMLDLIGKVDLAELASRMVESDPPNMLDVSTAGVYSDGGYYEVPASDLVRRHDGVFVRRSDMLDSPSRLPLGRMDVTSERSQSEYASWEKP